MAIDPGDLPPGSLLHVNLDQGQAEVLTTVDGALPVSLAVSPAGDFALAIVPVESDSEVGKHVARLIDLRTGNMETVEPSPFVGYGQGSLPVFWSTTSARVYYDGGVLDLAGRRFTPILPEQRGRDGTWVGWDVDATLGQVAALWASFESRTLDLYVSTGSGNGPAEPRLRNLGPAPSMDGFFTPHDVSWLDPGRTVLFEESGAQDSTERVVAIPIASGEKTMVATGYRHPRAWPGGERLLAYRTSSRKGVVMTLTGQLLWEFPWPYLGFRETVKTSPDGCRVALATAGSPPGLAVVDAFTGSVTHQGPAMTPVGWTSDSSGLYVVAGWLPAR